MNQDDGQVVEPVVMEEAPLEEMTHVAPEVTGVLMTENGGEGTLDVGGEEETEHRTSNIEHPTSNEEKTVTVPGRRVLSGGWTMGLLLAGIAIIAGCVLIPAGDQTWKLMYEREKLRGDLAQIEKQAATNAEFLKQVQSDPTLAQRLAQRQMKLLPAGTQVLEVADASPTKDDKSPFLIVNVPKPVEMAPYQARGGLFSQMCRNGRSQLYMIGGGLMLVAAGLVLGASGERR